MPKPGPFPLEMSIEPKSADDHERLRAALQTNAATDPEFDFAVDAESRQLILKAAGEMHLDGIIDRIINKEGIACSLGAPQVAYRETIAASAESRYSHMPLRSRGKRASVGLVIEPNERGAGNEFISEVDGAIIPASCIAAIEAVINSRLADGFVLGFPIVDVQVFLVEVEYNFDDDPEAALTIAARSALAEACHAAGEVLLEPVMNVEIVTPNDAFGTVIDDLNVRRGYVLKSSMVGDVTIVEAHVPLGNLFGYVSQLRSISGARANHSMKFSHYAEIPRNIDGDGTFPPAIGKRA